MTTQHTPEHHSTATQFLGFDRLALVSLLVGVLAFVLAMISVPAVWVYLAGIVGAALAVAGVARTAGRDKIMSVVGAAAAVAAILLMIF